MSQLHAIAPIDGRYGKQTAHLTHYFSEYALIKYRVFVEIKYFLALQKSPVGSFGLNLRQIEEIEEIAASFTDDDALRIKEIESITNHDVKAVEYFIKERLDAYALSELKEWVHFGLTSQDINNTAFPLMIRDAWSQVIEPKLKNLIQTLESAAQAWRDIPMLARTHGQPASPTTLGKEIMVFVSRLQSQMDMMPSIPWQGKFGGATGNMNAHYIAFPNFDWHQFGKDFLRSIGLQRQGVTTQIEHYDMLAAHFQGISRINTILTDFSRDIWQYISMEYFTQKMKEGEVGSSAMPHKVNPIDFENAEGNLGISNALLQFLASKLPVSRLQRDLTDSTVLRNIGVPYAHLLIALQSLEKGWGKLVVNHAAIQDDLDRNNIVLAEAVQTILRREHFEGAYEALKTLTRGRTTISKAELDAFADNLEVTPAIKQEIKALSVTNYFGKVNF